MAAAKRIVYSVYTRTCNMHTRKFITITMRRRAHQSSTNLFYVLFSEKPRQPLGDAKTIKHYIESDGACARSCFCLVYFDISNFACVVAVIVWHIVSRVSSVSARLCTIIVQKKNKKKRCRTHAVVVCLRLP